MSRAAFFDRFVAAGLALRDSADAADLTAAVETESGETAERLFAWDVYKATLSGLLSDAYTTAAASIHEEPEGHAKAPATLRGWIQKNSAAEVDRVARGGRQVIREAIKGRMFGTLSSADAAALVRGVVVLNANGAKAVAELAQQLFEKGASVAQVTKATTSYAEELLRRRAEVIIEHESARARAAAQRFHWDAMREAGTLPKGAKRLWVALPSCCDACGEADGQERDLDTPFDLGELGEVDLPPAHLRCRCRVVLVDRGRHAAEPVPETLADPSPSTALEAVLTRVLAALETLDVRLATPTPPATPPARTYRIQRDARGTMTGVVAEPSR